MKRINAYPFFLLGWCFGIFKTHLSPGISIGKMAGDAVSARTQLELFINDPILPLKLSKETAKNLLVAIDHLTSEDRLQKDWNSTLSVHERISLWENVSNFVHVLAAEVAQANVYLVDQKRPWDISILIEEGERLLPETALQSLSKKEAIKNDLREAARSLAFDIPTAVGFHMFRAVESVVTEYFPVLNISSIKDSDRNLGNYIRILENNGTDKKIIGMLRHLKDQYRNPISHPEIFLNPDEAANVFAFAQSAIAAMIENLDVERRKRATSSGGTP